MRQDRSDNSLVWLFSRCCSAWKCGGNLDRKALGIGTQQTFCATAWNLIIIERKKMQNVKATELYLVLIHWLDHTPLDCYCSQQDCLGIVLLCMMSRPSAPSCTGADLPCPWLCCWFTPFVLRTASALKLNAIFMITVSGTFFRTLHAGVIRASEPTCTKITDWVSYSLVIHLITWILGLATFCNFPKYQKPKWIDPTNNYCMWNSLR